MRIATSSLEGVALDFAIASANMGPSLSAAEFLQYRYSPTSNFKAAAGIVARAFPDDFPVMLTQEEGWGNASAGMSLLREFVRSVLGDEVEVPDELITP